MSGDGGIWRRERKRPNGQTYVRWVAQHSVGPRSDRHVVRRVCRTKGEAIDALAEMRKPTGSRQSLGDWLRSWLDDTVSDSVSPNTRRGYRAVIASLSAIHTIPLGDLTVEDIESVINGLKAQRHGQEKAKPASPKTRHNALAMLRTALDRAHERGYVERNEAKLVKMPRVPRRQRQALTPETARSLLAAVKKDRYEAAYALGLCGLRLGEVLGLAWEDVDLEAGTINVRYQAVGSGKKAQRAQLKTRGSEAPIAIPPFVVERLREHRRLQREERLAKGWPQLDEGHVFITERGYVVNGSWLSKHLGDRLEAAKMEPMGFHALRHGAATLLGHANVHPRIAMEYLRHSQVKTTMEVYTSVSRAQQREAADTLERLIGEAG